MPAEEQETQEEERPKEHQSPRPRSLWPSPRARCRPGFLTLGRRRTPAPLRAPAAPSSLGAPAPFKPSSQAPRRAPPATRVPYRESPAPSPSRRRPRPSTRGQGQNGRLASPHETKKQPPPPPSEGTVQLLCPHGGFCSKETDKETLTCVVNRQGEISSKHKPGEFSEVGYFQGTNEVVAILLMFLNEDDTFWGLFQLMTGEKHAMHSRCLEDGWASLKIWGLFAGGWWGA
ncbi:serine/arginine repetitive matrix protein 1-like [Moschus berezovskii]|uniref:serine/arginine repetitive matrix protein 1-like n=1 Tax=Moschus berezovskii TaxID=68408 RepID=UPI0024449842|nr:serine/arginine repetitive matrix protein 1-like [Moschus berezovskii]